MTDIKGFWVVSMMVGVAGVSLAFRPPEPTGPLQSRAYTRADLRIPSSNVALSKVHANLPNRRDWDRFLGSYGSDFDVFIDPRSGLPSRVSGHIPMIPGTGLDNRVTLADLSRQLGRAVTRVDGEVLEDLTVRFVVENQAAFGIDVGQMGQPRAVKVTPYLWHVFIDQEVDGIPVRYGHMVATYNHGNLIIFGTETWGNVGIDTTPTLSAEDALAVGFNFVGGRLDADTMWKEPELEVVPFDPAIPRLAETIGGGYDHRLTWVFGFRREGDDGSWEVMVDALTGEVLAFEDTNHYANAQITGGVYPITATGTCPSPTTCGRMQSNYPMPYADTGLAAPNDVTNSAGVFEYTGGTARTTLSGPYLHIYDNCGAINETGSGNISMGGSNGQHDCQSAGSSGNTPASRTAFYELMKLKEQAAGWIPGNWWNNGQLVTNVNINNTCNAYWNGTVNFYRSGGGCRNTGELAGVFDHEWGHGLDQNDGGPMSNPSEAYADIAAMYRLQTSCMGYGFFWSKSYGCGSTSDGTGQNHNEAQTGSKHCARNCSGVREADWYNHANRVPDTPTNFVCPSCVSGNGPCGREVHCAAAPSNQAAWDLATRDLQSAPYNYDRTTAFIVANKLFYHGSVAISLWHSCDCGGGTSDGCGSMSGYIQWLAADDDNGNLYDGTPHMTAIYNAFARHNIACSSPTPQTWGCPGGPTAAPTLTVEPGNYKAKLNWTSVPNAQFYWVFRTEGHADCNLGKALIAWVAGTSYIDTEVAVGREYWYTVVPATGDFACYGRASNCENVIPVTSGTAEYVVGSARQIADSGDDDGWPDNCETVTAQVGLVNEGNGSASSVTADITSSSPYVTILTPMPISVGSIGSGSTKTASFEYAVTSASCGSVLPFTITVDANQMSFPSVRTFNFTAELDSLPPADYNFSFESDLEGWTVASGTFVRFAAGAEGTWAVRSSAAQSNQCDIIRSPTFIPTAATTLDVAISFDIEPCSNGWCHDRANIGVWDGAQQMVIYPTYNQYNAWGYGGSCGTENHYGWSGQFGYQWYDTNGYDFTPWLGTPISLDVRYGAGPSGNLYQGFAFDWVRLTNVSLLTCDAQPDDCSVPPAPDGNTGTLPLTLAKTSGSTIRFQWDASCSAANYNIIHGDLASLSSWSVSGSRCGIGTSGSHNWSSPPAGSSFFLVVGTDQVYRESSWGRDSAGVERNGTTPSYQCGVTAKDTSGSCTGGGT